MQYDDDNVPPSTKRLAVLETEEHAEEVLARSHGQDRLEYNYATYGQARPGLPSPARIAGHDWESFRPVEVPGAPPPVVAYPERWNRSRGRFCALGGMGRHALMLLRARRNY